MPINLLIGRVLALPLLLFVHAALVIDVYADPPVLDFDYMNKTAVAADLSLIAYFPSPENRNKRYDTFVVYNDEPNRAILARQNGACFVAFRGTQLDVLASFVPTISDVFSNFIPGSRSVCPLNATRSNCCTTRTGFWRAYDTSYRAQLEGDIRTCTLQCPDKNKCLYFTGHSQGGSVAQIAAVVWEHMQPHAITFGSEATLNPDCDIAKNASHRWVRYVNTRVEGENTWLAGSRRSLQYDALPFLVLSLGSDAVPFGYTFLLTDDASSVANVGNSNSLERFTPYDFWFLFRSHRIPVYESRIAALIGPNTYPIRSDGYADGFLCSRGIECQSGICGGSTSGGWWIFGRTKVCLGSQPTQANNDNNLLEEQSMRATAAQQAVTMAGT